MVGPLDDIWSSRTAIVRFFLAIRMQEQSAVGLRLMLGDDATEWAILGNYQECRESLARCRDAMGLTHVTCQFYNVPEELSARLEYLEGFGEEVIQKLAG